MNSLKEIESSLRSMAKRYKTVKFSTGIAISFLMLGINAFAETSNLEFKAMTRGEISKNLKGMSPSFKKIREKNNKALKGAKLEYIKLMEQGNQVVKSPWSSWQFGINYYYDDVKGSYKGRGDKKEKYPYEGIFKRDPWYLSQINEYSLNYNTLEKGNNKFSATTTSREADRELNYGFINRKKLDKNPANLKLSASIKTRNISLSPMTLTPSNGDVDIKLEIPNLVIKNFSPKSPIINTPILAEVPNIQTPGAGGGNSGVVGFWYKDGEGEDRRHSVMSEIDILTGEIDGTFIDDDTLKFSVKDFKIQKGNNGKTTTSFQGIPETEAPYTKALTSGENGVAESVNGRADQAIIKQVDTAVARYKKGTKITATNDIENPSYGKQILHYDEHYRKTNY